MAQLARLTSIALASALAAQALAQTAPPAGGTGVAAGPGATTAEIFRSTLQAAPTCVRYTPTGACLWLKCVYFKCSVRVTVRIEHFTPDLAISTWHDPANHPWTDYGRRVAGKLDGAGTKLVGKATGNAFTGLIDSGGSRSPSPLAGKGPQRAGHNYHYRGADAIGNPLNLIGWLMGGSGKSSESSSIPIPMPFELMKFYAAAGSQVAKQWASVPSSYSSQSTSYASSQSAQYMSLLGKVGDLYSTYTKYADTVKGLDGMMDISKGNVGGGESGGGSDGGGGGSQGSGSAVGTGQGSEWFCPPGVMPFGLLFNSELDAWFWRGLLPLELIFPAPWLPGMREVGDGLAQTWGSVWPRQGSLFQQNPVKGSAVLAQRVGDILSDGAQPHIYTPLDLTPSGYRWFGFQGIREHDDKQTRWQRIYPNPQSSCMAFGSNDSLALTGFGDNQNVSEQGFIWAAWRRQECCNAPGGYVFIGSVGR